MATFYVGDRVRYKRGREYCSPFTREPNRVFTVQCIDFTRPNQCYLQDNSASTVVGDSCNCLTRSHNWVADMDFLELVSRKYIDLDKDTVKSVLKSSTFMDMSSYHWDFDASVAKAGMYYYGGASFKPKKSIMEITREKVSMFFKSEPEKSFIRAGILNNDETFTAEGKVIFFDWLFKKHGAEFKAEIVDPIIAEMKSEKNG